MQEPEIPLMCLGKSTRVFRLSRYNKVLQASNDMSRQAGNHIDLDLGDH